MSRRASESKYERHRLSAIIEYVTRERIMDEGRGSAQQTGRGGRVGRGVVHTYLWTAAALAILRVSVLAWLEYRAISNRYSVTVDDFIYRVLSPEILLAGYTRVGAIHFQDIRLQFLFWASLLTLGSFVIATPILLVGWLRRRRR
jgi:hypothetical protein